MAPSSGPLLLPKLWRAARFAYEKVSRAVRSQIQEPAQTLRLQPAYSRVSYRQPLNRAAAIRQARGRHFSTRATSAFASYLQSGLLSASSTSQGSRISSAINRLTSRSPFASTLRPNLTGGALGRTAGGYAIGAGRIGGARYFSHGPAIPAQVVKNVSAAMRGFLLSGQKARFDGMDPHTGEKRYKAVTALQDQVERHMEKAARTAPGSYIDFQLSPAITAFGVLQERRRASAEGLEPVSLNSEGLMYLLSVDFARALKDFAAVINDLKRLATLGNLSVSLCDKSTIRVRFPGCDADQVERLCDEVGVERGRIFQDEDFEVQNGTDLALLFPFAPSVVRSPEMELFTADHPSEPDKIDWRIEARTQTSPGFSGVTSLGLDFADTEIFGGTPWTKPSPSNGSGLSISELGDREFFPGLNKISCHSSSPDYGGIEGIYKFLSECDRAVDHRR
ncbi:hypothetical protein Egran_01562 [Elaphomyces granulatus]|uniref:Casein kinase II beta 2 subunit n=1 Tax=Elaphomyces granulatus TaxID=519963 RepID=A0A232M2S2_9EURO|nr:hypothetical protein Egran_01562 [Elaphomyces granulatus]